VSELLGDGEGLAFVGETPAIDAGGMGERLACDQACALELRNDFARRPGRQVRDLGDLHQGERHRPPAISQVNEGHQKRDLFQAEQVPEAPHKCARDGQKTAGGFLSDLSLDDLHGACLSSFSGG
jgi:hypothetical protein